MNSKILKNIKRSPVKKSLFLDSSTPIKHANAQNPLSMADNRSSSIGVGNEKYAEQMPDFADYEIAGLSQIKSRNTQQMHNVSADSRLSSKSLSITDF